MKRTVTLLAVAVALVAPPARAQFESPLLSRLQLNPVNPGGKSIAMGGAFVSTADDATAAIANPAGLPQLTSWQLGASGKTFDFQPTLLTASYDAGPGDQFELFLLDSYQPKGRINDLEFASVVAPLFENVTVALYQAVTLRYRIDASDLDGGSYRSFFVRPHGIPPTPLSTDEAGGLDIRNQLFGLSLGTRLGPLSLGGGVTFSKLTYDFTGGAAGGPHTIITNSQSSSTRIDVTVGTEVTSGTGFGFIVGMKYELIETSRLAVGAVFRKFPSFDVDYRIAGLVPSTGQRFAFSCGVDAPNIPASGTSACGSVKLPDDFSVGISGILLSNLYAAIEVQHIRYSQLNEGFVPLYTYNRGQSNQSIANGSTVNVTIPRFGLEYTLGFGSSLDLSLRAGYYHEPAHGTTLALYPDLNSDRKPDSDVPNEIAPTSDAYRTAFNGGEAEEHYSFGLGATISRKLSIDFAADIGKSTRYAVVSAFYRF